MSILRSRWSVIVLLLAMVAATAFSTLRFSVETSMARFLPGDERELLDVAGALSDSALTRRMVFRVSATGPRAGERSSSAARDLATGLRALEGITRVRAALDAGSEQEFYRIYFPRRMLLLVDTPSREPFSDAELAAMAARLRDRLAAPDSALVRGFAPRDPWLAFPTILQRLERARLGSLTIRDGLLTAADGSRIVMAELRASALDGAKQGPLLDGVAACVAEAQRASGDVRVEYTGLNRFAAFTEASIRDDVQRIGIISAAFVVLLLMVLFGSPRYLLLGVITLGAALVGGFAATLALYGSVHSLGLAFGAALIGVAIDYPIHIATRHALDDCVDGFSALERIGRGLTTAAATTLAGLGALSFTGFPVLKETAVFAGAGIVSALLATAVLAPRLMPVPGRATRVEARLAGALASALAALRQRRLAAWAPLGLAVVVLALALPRFRFDDDLRSLTPSSPALLEEDQRVRDAVGQRELGRFVVALGPDLETALQRNDAVALALDAVRAGDHLAGFSSAHAWLWSEELQERNRRRFATDATLAQRTSAALGAAGFHPKAFAAYQRDLETAPASLRLADLEQSSLAGLVSPFISENGAGFAVFTFLEGVRSAAAIEQALTAIPGTHYFDQRDALNRAYAGVRENTTQAMGVGLALILCLIALRYRRPRVVGAAFVPALVGGLSTLGALTLLGVSLNLFHMMASLLVLSMGADYGIFLAEIHADGSPDEAGSTATRATLLAIVAACATTMLSFGLLAVSVVPALRAIGQTVALGAGVSLLVAPCALVVLGRAR